MIQIRREEPHDIAGVHAVNAAAFPTPAEAKLVDLLRANRDLTLSLAAIDEEHVVGHVAFSPLNIESGLGLAPLAVLPTHQRRGIGAALVRAGLDECQRAGFGFVVVLGNPNYYARFGFRPASEWGLIDEYGGGEAFQAMELKANAIPRGIGLVRYAPAFASLTDDTQR